MRVSTTIIVTPCLLGALACSDNAVTAIRAADSPHMAKAPSNPTVTFFIANDPAYYMRGDGAYLEGASSPFAGASRYMAGECGIGSTFFYYGSGDATMGTSNGRCVRRIRVTYERINADGTTTAEGSSTEQTFMNVRQVEIAASGTTPATYIPIGSTEQRTYAFDDEAKCGSGTSGIVFADVLRDGTIAGGDLVNVHRDAADTWTVSTTPDEIDSVTGATIHHDKAYCKGNGKLYHLPLHFSIRSSVPLSP